MPAGAVRAFWGIVARLCSVVLVVGFFTLGTFRNAPVEPPVLVKPADPFDLDGFPLTLQIGHAMPELGQLHGAWFGPLEGCWLRSGNRSRGGRRPVEGPHPLLRNYFVI